MPHSFHGFLTDSQPARSYPVPLPSSKLACNRFTMSFPSYPDFIHQLEV